ncbi:TonB-dependent receptor [Sphingobacterium wenxiniae]|uniref:Carboxypeptidase regulatory-like domain-containing protein n=1 Tax=Sphingobacterium wenxiniae TaxID=683125 RepID=A0A1I6R581_9SPHI|nr:TonB-dependent receptor [Sphingobacterium wenxiniae]SFS59836.1 Carboxypeptidase regulatory-like domain-containing protein [Sphingobacterium wenxiniae]
MTKYIFLFLFISITYNLFAQQSVEGIIVNQADNKALENASIVLLDSDSIMRYFARSDEAGRFRLEKVTAQPYLLLVTYPKFEIYSTNIDLKAQDLKLDSIKIDSRTNILEEIVITQKIPIKIKGDTIEYDAGSFETEKNAKLEDLLRRLPGLTVSASGEITAQGKSVSKVLIDGEEFFGYDPKIAIRNVRADAVDKVQVYERKSEQAELTGVDDGVRLQTVNVILKEEARKGLFGNTAASLGTKQLFDANLFTAKFNQSERIGINGSWNNMGNSGDVSRIRMGNQIIGRPEHKSIGANYQNTFLQKKLNLNSSYNFTNNTQANDSENYSKQIISDNMTHETERKSTSHADNKNNTLRTQIRYKIDSLSNLNIQLNANKGYSESSSASSSYTIRNANNLANDFESRNHSDGEQESINLRLDYRRRLSQKGRSLNLHLNTQHSNNENNTGVDETTNLYNIEGVLDSTRRIDQNRLSDDRNNTMSASINFSEPISDKIYLTMGYNFNLSNRTGLTDAYNNNTQNLSLLDTLYSKNQRDKALDNGFDMNLSLRLQKFSINISNQMVYRQQELVDHYHNIHLTRGFWQNSLNAHAMYNISNSKHLNLSYQNRTNVPSFAQLQPIQPRTNELYVPIGNPNLKRENQHSFNFNFNRFSLLKASSFNINASIALTDNAIVNKTEIDEQGRTQATFVNITDHTNWNARLHTNYTKPIWNGLIQLGPYVSSAYNSSYLFINGELNKNNNTNLQLGISANKQNSKAIDFNLNIGTGIVNEENSVQTRLNNTTMHSNISTDLKYHLPYKFSLTQAIYYTYTGKTKVFPEPIQQFYMNMELTRKLLTSESLLLSVKAFDIFNTFNNRNRTFSNSMYSQNQQQMLTQYFMIGLKWDFNKNLGKKSEG